MSWLDGRPEVAEWVLDGHDVVLAQTRRQWIEMWTDPANRRVAEDIIGAARVSTVFLGLDHGFGSGRPQLFETMVFGGPHDEEQWRYSTWEEAEAGHARVVATLTDETAEPLSGTTGKPPS